MLARGADPLREDEFGHTPWLAALSRACEDADFARQAIAPLFERIAPPTLDVQTDSRLLRLERHQGEYWLLSLMLAGFKTQCSACVHRRLRAYKYRQGFFADQLHDTLDALPEHLWPARRRKRGYVSQVLARAEVHSAYQPARRLWARSCTGHYLPNPLMLLRTQAAGGDDDGEQGPSWRPVYELLNEPWVQSGCGDAFDQAMGPARALHCAALRVTQGVQAGAAAEREEAEAL